MAIFPFIEVGDIEQVNDKIRISGIKSFVSKDEADVTEIEIEPEASAGFISVFNSNSKNWFLDWEYATDGTKVISIRVTTDGAPITKTESIELLTEDDDKLFSVDDDLQVHETDILGFVPVGRNTFKYAHREAQTQIIEDIYRIGITDIFGDKLTKAAFIDVDEVKEWSRFLTLQMIYSDISNAVGDIFAFKRDQYKGWALESRHKAIMKLDLNGDATLDSTESVDITWRRLVRA